MAFFGFNNKRFLKEELIRREEPCRICGAKEGFKIGEADYWDLQHSSIIYCPSCMLVQLDPMLTAENTATGCSAYYLDELTRESIKEHERNLVRNYRRGVVFAIDLKRKGFSPVDILEFGPGSGYFMAGMQFVFPDCNITVVDIVDDVLRKNRETHGFETIYGSPEDTGILANRKFDLIVARDILEHVTDIGRVISNAALLLKPGGLFHFLTPNGYEDVWGHYIHWKHHHKPSELLINHVNYFDGKGLKDLLLRNAFLSVEYFTYQLKTTFRGKGWRMKQSLEADTSGKRTTTTPKSNVTGYASSGQALAPDMEVAFDLDKTKVLDRWYINPSMKWMTYLYCLYKHHWWIHLYPSRNIGHEISGLFRYQDSNP